MKKTFLLGAACILCIIAHAQVLEIVSMQQLSTPAGIDWKVAGMSPMGDYVLLTDGANQGLVRYDLTSNATEVISNANGAGFNVQISKDGQSIVYREATLGEDKLMRNDIVKHNLNTQQRSVQAKAQRDMSQLVDKAASYSVAINGDLHLVINRNGKQVVMHPNGAEHAYNWASLSPDGSKILYYVSGVGCYVCDLYGNNVQRIAQHCRAPQWYDNNTIIGMADEDDGQFITASAIVLYTLDGQHQILVDKNMVAMFPHVAEGKIAFANAGGEVYLMTVK